MTKRKGPLERPHSRSVARCIDITCNRRLYHYRGRMSKQAGQAAQAARPCELSELNLTG